MRAFFHIPLVTAITVMSATAVGTAQPTSKACGLLTAAEVAQALQRPELAKQRPIGSADPDVPGASDCGYGADFTTYYQPSLHQLPGKPPLSIDAFDKDAAAKVKSGDFTPLPGVGDAAWFYRNTIGKQYGVLVRVGQQLVRMSIPVSAAASEAAARDALTSLAKVVVAKLR